MSWEGLPAIMFLQLYLQQYLESPRVAISHALFGDYGSWYNGPRAQQIGLSLALTMLGVPWAALAVEVPSEGHVDQALDWDNISAADVPMVVTGRLDLHTFRAMHGFINGLETVHTDQNQRLVSWIPANAKEVLQRDAEAGFVTRESMQIALGILCSFLMPAAAVGEVWLPPNTILPLFDEAPPAPSSWRGISPFSVDDAAMRPTSVDITSPPSDSGTTPAAPPTEPSEPVTPAAPATVATSRQSVVSRLPEPVKFAVGAAAASVAAAGVVYLIARQVGRST